MVEGIQSESGDWWIVARGLPMAVHLRGRSDVETKKAAADHAARLFPGEAVIARSVAEKQTDEPGQVSREQPGSRSGIHARA